jgi:hypothetical protein
MFGLHVNLFLDHHTGIRAIIPHVACESAGDDWGLMIRQSETIDVLVSDDQLAQACAMFDLDVGKYSQLDQRVRVMQFASLVNVTNLINACADRWVWTSNPAQNSSRSRVRHYEGLELLVKNVIEFSGPPGDKLNDLIASLYSDAPADVELVTVSDWMMDRHLPSQIGQQRGFPVYTSHNDGALSHNEVKMDVYVLPIKQNGESVLNELFLDYSHCLGVADSMCSDDGRYLWSVEFCHFDMRILGRYQSKIELLLPEYATRIKDICFNLKDIRPKEGARCSCQG